MSITAKIQNNFNFAVVFLPKSPDVNIRVWDIKMQNQALIKIQ